jgi:hypothetical protein
VTALTIDLYSIIKRLFRQALGHKLKYYLAAYEIAASEIALSEIDCNQ